MHRYFRSFILLILCSFLASCNLPQAAALPVAVLPAAGTVVPQLLYQVPPNATPTATPFQPVEPTPVFFPTSTPQPTPTPLPTATPTPFYQVVDEGGEVVQPPNQVNILLLGSDKRPGQSGFRTDTIILVTLNSELGTVNLTSFPRDLYVPIPGYGTNRINTAFGAGGFKLLANTFKENFGVRPDFYVLVNFKQFKRFVDDLGGLEVKVGETVSDYRAGRWHTIEKGLQHMDADDVLWYVRTRKTTSDLQRNRRQQEVLQAIYQRMMTLDALTHIPEIYDAYDDSVITDMSWKDILPLVPIALRITDLSRINHYFIGPGQTTDWITYEGAMVLLPIQSEVDKVLRKALNLKR